MRSQGLPSLGVALLVVAACSGPAAPTVAPTTASATVTPTTAASVAGPTTLPTAAAAVPTLQPTVDGVQNGRIAYAVRANGSFNLFSALPDGTGELQLTTSTTNSLCAAFSADGTRIAYCADAGGPFEIWTMLADGTKEAQLTHLGGRSLFPDFSPDGRKIAFGGTVGADVHNEIYTVSATTGDGLVALTTCTGKLAGCYNDYPAWSPDGKSIVYIHADDFDGEIPVNEQVWLMDADGLHQHPLTTGPIMKDQVPSWSPDGKFIVYANGAGDSEGIWVMAADGSAPTQLSGCLAGEAAPCAAGSDSVRSGPRMAPGLPSSEHSRPSAPTTDPCS